MRKAGWAALLFGARDLVTLGFLALPIVALFCARFRPVS